MTRITQLNQFAFVYKGMFNWYNNFFKKNKDSGFYSEQLRDGRILVFHHEVQWAIWDPKTGNLNTNAHISKIQ